jgi:ClpP class serine protease
MKKVLVITELNYEEALNELIENQEKYDAVMITISSNGGSVGESKKLWQINLKDIKHV